MSTTEFFLLAVMIFLAPELTSEQRRKVVTGAIFAVAGSLVMRFV